MLQFLPALILLLLPNPQNLERFEAEFGVGGRNLQVRTLESVAPLIAAWLASENSEEEPTAATSPLPQREPATVLAILPTPSVNEGFARFQRDRAGPA